MLKRSVISAPRFSLRHTLASGQTFCWLEPQPGEWQGYIYDIPCRIRQAGTMLKIESPPSLCEDAVRRYFNLNADWDERLQQLPRDAWLDQALNSAAGLHCVRENGWECISNFICSSLKQVPHIIQINLRLRREFGEALAGPDQAYSFPGPEKIAAAGEEALRKCRLGYRARHLHRAARMIADGHFCWENLQDLSTEEASSELQKVPGIGEKVAHCILLYAANRYDCFPMDVWILRLMKELYDPKRRKPLIAKELHKKSFRLFGENRGIAQLYLYHWYRTMHHPGQKSLLLLKK